MAEADEGRPPARTPSALGQASIRIPGPNSDTEVDPYSLPSTVTTDQLIHVFFSTVHLFLPCLDERAFLRKYHACHKGIRPSTATVSGAWLGSFYIVLSLACQCLEAKSPDSNRVAESEIYYRKAVNAGMKQAIYGMGFEVGECFSYIPFNLAHIFTVQFLVLITAYLQSTHRSNESWTFHSLAVKSALQIALYSKSSFARLPTSEQALRQKCWLCLIYNDRWVLGNSDSADADLYGKCTEHCFRTPLPGAKIVQYM